MKKLLAFIVIIFSTFLISCSNYKDINLSLVDSKITENINMETFSKGTSKELRRYFNLKATDFSEFILYTPAYTMDVNEILILKLKSDANIDVIQDLIDSRVTKQIETFASYGPNQCAMLNDYTLKVKGDYLFYCTSTDSDEIYNIFLESIK